MREILFRGKEFYTGEWVEGYYVKGVTRHGIVKSFVCHPRYDVIPETVGQFTGLTDKNGKRIFEGDILSGLFLFGLSVNAVVKFQYGAFGLEWCRGGIKTFDAFTSICHVEYEVLGNIHDNPELLK